MFDNARLKLTFFYVLIVMIVSVLFSSFIYVQASHFFEAGFGGAERRLRELNKEVVAQSIQRQRLLVIEEMVEDAKDYVLVRLYWVNLVVFLVTATGSYTFASRSLKPIKDAMEEQERFIADASHELRTPLTSLRTSLEVGLRDRRIKLSDAQELLRSSLEDVVRLQGLTDDLLRLSRYESMESLDLDDVDVPDLIKSAISDMASIAEDKSIAFDTSNIQRISVKGHADSLHHVLVILIDNAIKYSPFEGKVEISTSKKGDNYLISVKDFGEGIDPQDFPYVFKRFYRSDKSRTTYGYGLGLSLAQKIVEKNKGEILVESSVGSGSKFSIKLPLSA